MSQPGAQTRDSDPELKLLGRALAQLRADRGFTQDTASAAFGTSPQNWAKYENGRAPTLYRPDVQRRLTKAIGSDMEELQMVRARLAGEPAPRPTPLGTWDASNFASPRGEPSVLPIRHRLQAAWVLDDEGAIYGHYHLTRDPRFHLADQWLAEVLDDHAEGLGIRRGDLAHMVSAEDAGYWPRTGDVVEVERRRDDDERELTLRQVEVTATATLLWPRSSNPRMREPVALPADPRAAPDGPRIVALLLAATRRF